MNQEGRPNPDALLSVLTDLEKKEGKGELRIFLGMSAGVGKTYAMLKAAHQKLSQGVDLVVGVVETHGRPETLQLTKGLPTLPLKKIDYRGTQLEELDLDEVLKRKPELVIVDELAHSNVPGSRHEKRYQDVIELLDAGIHVFTAFNVQHLESRKDSVEAITGVVIRETVPDSMLERANLVELVDIAPPELLKRLRDGKVYQGERAERAGQNFFKEDKLTALREIALRITAERVDQDLQKLASLRSEGAPWQTNERLLVAVSHSPSSETLIRGTRRLAYNLEAPWVALNVDTGINLGEVDQAQLSKNLALARELKAEVITTTEVSLADAVARVCREKNVTQVVVGRPTRRWFRDILERGNLLESLTKKSLGVDIHILRQDSPSQFRPSLAEELSYYRSKTGLEKYFYSVGTLALACLAGALLNPYLGYRSVGFLFLLLVVVLSAFGSIGVVILTATLSALAWDYFFIPPALTFAIGTSEDLLMCLSFFVVALITGFLTNRIRFHEKIIRDREETTRVLYEVLQDIANSNQKSDFLNKVSRRVGDLLGAECGVFFDGKVEGLVALQEKDQAVAQWAFENKKNAGWSTDTLSESSALYIPMRGSSAWVGVFIFKPLKKKMKLSVEKENLLFSIVRQLGVSLERQVLLKKLIETRRLEDSEKLHQTLLNSISHEIRTPLTSMLGMAAALDDEKMRQNPNFVKEVSLSLQLAGDRLNRVIENLLDMSRLNSGVLSLHLEWHDPMDLIGVVLKKLEKPLRDHLVQVKALDSVCLIRMDYRLMEHALSNLLLNATLYTPKTSEIRISVEIQGSDFVIKVEDSGPGIPEKSLPRIFDKFYRVPGSPTGGTGLGLSIAQSIVELHKGRLTVSNRSPQGACFEIRLPLEEAPKMPEEGL